MQVSKIESNCHYSSGNISQYEPHVQQIHNSTSMSTLGNENFCRICHDISKKEDLFSYCQCKGSVGLAHSSCLLFWIKKSGSVRCEICKEKYSTIAQLNKIFWQWELPHIGAKGWLKLVFFLGFLSMLITFTTWIIWSTTSSSSEAKQERSKRQVEYTYLVYGMLLLISIVGIYAINFQPFIRYVSRCIVMNQSIEVIPKGELCKSKEDVCEAVKQKNCGTEDTKCSKHDFGTMKDTCVQVQHTKYDLNKYMYIKFGTGSGSGDITMV